MYIIIALFSCLFKLAKFKSLLFLKDINDLRFLDISKAVFNSKSMCSNVMLLYVSVDLLDFFCLGKFLNLLVADEKQGMFCDIVIIFKLVRLIDLANFLTILFDLIKFFNLCGLTFFLILR